MKKPVTYTNQGMSGEEYSAISFHPMDYPEEPNACVEITVLGNRDLAHPAADDVYSDEAYDVVLDKEQAIHLHQWLGDVLGKSTSKKIIE